MDKRILDWLAYHAWVGPSILTVGSRRMYQWSAPGGHDLGGFVYRTDGKRRHFVSEYNWGRAVVSPDDALELLDYYFGDD